MIYFFEVGQGTEGHTDRYLNHLYTNKKWNVQQERIQIAESITPTAHLMNSSPTRSINIFKTERIRYLSPDPSRPSHRPSQPRSRRYTKSSHYHLPHAYLRRASALAHWYLTCNQGGSSKV